MDESIFLARELAAKLSVHRTSGLENELSKVFRGLPEVQQQEIIAQLLQGNVRLAAAVAARGGISGAQQIVLLRLLLESGRSNALKVMIQDLFAHRMGAKVFARVLQEYRSRYSDSVHLAAYYFLGSAKMSSKTRGVLRSLRDATRPVTQEGS